MNPLKAISKLFFFTALALPFSPFYVQAQRVTINFDAPPASLSVSKAPLRYNKDFAYSISFDDGTADHFQVAYPLLAGGKMDDGQTYPGLHYTDGCGNSLPFRAGEAWTSANPSNIDVHTGNVSWQMTWGQLDTLYNAGWDVYNSSFSFRSNVTNVGLTANDYNNEIIKNAGWIRDHTSNRILTAHFVVPAGDTNYYAPAKANSYKGVYDQNFRLPGYTGLNISSPLPLSGPTFLMFRYKFDNPVLGRSPLDSVALKSSGTARFWYNEFVKRIASPGGKLTDGVPFATFSAYMNYIEKTYGGKGSDRVWAAPAQEIYEYAAVRDASILTLNKSGKQAFVDVNTAGSITGLRHKSLTLIVNSDANFSDVQADGARVVSFKGSGTQKIVNLEFDSVSSKKAPYIEFTRASPGVVPILGSYKAAVRILSNAGVSHTSYLIDGVSLYDVYAFPYGATFGFIPEGPHVYSVNFTDTLGRVSNTDTIHILATKDAKISPTADLADAGALTLYPNPALGLLWLKLPPTAADGVAAAFFTDALGRVVLENRAVAFTGGVAQADVSALAPNALYLLHLKMGGLTFRRTFLKR